MQMFGRLSDQRQEQAGRNRGRASCLLATLTFPKVYDLSSNLTLD
jgi:hypothetical protein